MSNGCAMLSVLCCALASMKHQPAWFGVCPDPCYLQTYKMAVVFQAWMPAQHIHRRSPKSTACKPQFNLSFYLPAAKPTCRALLLLPADESDQENTTAVAAFGQVVAYCVTESCRRALVLGHFGEALPKGACSGCDCCQEPETVSAQVAIGLVRCASLLV